MEPVTRHVFPAEPEGPHAGPEAQDEAADRPNQQVSQILRLNTVKDLHQTTPLECQRSGCPYPKGDAPPRTIELNCGSCGWNFITIWADPSDFFMRPCGGSSCVRSFPKLRMQLTRLGTHFLSQEGPDRYPLGTNWPVRFLVPCPHCGNPFVVALRMDVRTTEIKFARDV